MGLSLGGSAGGTTSSSTGSSQQANVYNPTQQTTQGMAATQLQNALSAQGAGTLTPGVQAMETTSADQINKTAAGTTSRVNQMLAARGLGQSGQTGQATLQGELARESALGSNTAQYAGMQSQMNSQNLLAALNYAFTSLGSTASGTSTGKSSGWGVGGGVGGSFGGGGGGGGNISDEFG
jgi:hypothetical protein